MLCRRDYFLICWQQVAIICVYGECQTRMWGSNVFSTMYDSIAVTVSQFQCYIWFCHSKIMFRWTTIKTSFRLKNLSDLVLQNKNSDFCAPLTSFDWNEVDPNLLGTSSIDTTCTIWGLEVCEPFVLLFHNLLTLLLSLTTKQIKIKLVVRWNRLGCWCKLYCGCVIITKQRVDVIV